MALQLFNTASGSPVYSAVTSLLSAKDPAPPSGYPKAYLNWILLDDQFNYVSTASGSIAVASTTYPTGQFNTIAAGGPIVMPRNSYFYVWVSNETQGWDVFFDNFTVQYKQGPVLEENHYYPFGLTMAGISDKAVKTNYAENKYRWNKGSELQNKEFSDGSGLEMYETPLRELDPQLGRWWQVDPVFTNGVDGDDEVNEVITEGLKSQSPYASMDNNPIRLEDPKGDCPPCLAQVPVEEVVPVVEEWGTEAGHAIAAAATVTGVWLSSIRASPGSTGINGGSMYAVPLGNDAAMNMSQPAATIALTPADQDALNKLDASLGLSIVQKGPKDLVQEAKDQKEKEEQAAARAANRSAQTANGKAKTGKSNQQVRGDHANNKRKSNSDKHGKRIARALREQRASDQRNNNSNNNNNNNQQQQQK